MQQQTEISISDVLGFLRSNWKLYFACLILFVLAALGMTVVSPHYTASLTLKHNVQNRPAGALLATEDLYDGHFDLVTWRAIQEKLILIARQEADRSDNNSKLLSEMSSASWWAQHVAPVKSLTSDEAKELLGINAMIVGTNKPTEDSNAVQYLGRAIKESTRISGLAITFEADTPHKAIESTEAAADNIKNIAGVLRFTNYVAGLEKNILDSTSINNLEFSQLNRDLSHFKMRQKELERLHKAYPDAPRVLPEGDFRQEQSTKYLPLTNQLIANSLSIFDIENRISQITELNKQNELIAKFNARLQAVLSKTSTYSVLYQEMAAIQEAMRKQIADTDFAAMQQLDTIQYQLTTIRQIAQDQFSKTSVTIIKKPDYYRTASKAAFLGLVIGFLLSLLILLVRKSGYQRP